MMVREALIIATVTFVLGVYPPISAAQSVRPPAGMEIHVIVPDGTSISTFDPSSGESGDMVIFTGKSVGLKNLGGCAEGWSNGHVQSATVVDPGDHRATRLTNDIVVTFIPIVTIIDELPPLAAGTRLSSIVFDHTCAIAGIPYDKYRAVTE